MKKIFILVCSCALLAACNNSAKTNKSAGADSTSIEVTDIHNAENSLDYEGTYKGVFPAADCPGIETTLTLNPDKTFSLFLGKAHLRNRLSGRYLCFYQYFDWNLCSLRIDFGYCGTWLGLFDVVYLVCWRGCFIIHRSCRTVYWQDL